MTVVNESVVQGKSCFPWRTIAGFCWPGAVALIDLRALINIMLYKVIECIMVRHCNAVSTNTGTELFNKSTLKGHAGTVINHGERGSVCLCVCLCARV